MKNFTLSLLLLASAALGLAGCGAGSGGGKNNILSAASRKLGRAAITLKWPARTASRLVPIASNRVVVTLKKNGVLYGSPVIFDRPVSGSFITTQTVDSVPTGAYTADAIAYPDANSGSTAQAKVLNQTFTVTDGETANLNLTMASAISTIAVSGHDDLHSVVADAKLQLSAAAKDSANNTVLTSGTLTYSSSNTSAATVNPTTGLVTTVAAGSTIITVTDAESGVHADYPLAVPAAWPYITYLQGGAPALYGVDDFNGTNSQSYDATRGSHPAIGDVRGIARDKEGRLYIAAYTAGVIIRINEMSGAGYTTLNVPLGQSLNPPSGVAVDNQDRIYIVDAIGSKIVRVDNMNGDNWTELGSFGAGTGQFQFPVSIAVDAQNRIYVTDIDNQRLSRMDDMTGAGWVALTSMGGAGLVSPYSVAVRDNGGIYVADASGDRICYAADMNDMVGASFGTTGSGTNQFATPIGVALDDSGKIYIADTYNSRLVCINSMTGSGWHTYNVAGADANSNHGLSHLLIR